MKIKSFISALTIILLLLAHNVKSAFGQVDYGVSAIIQPTCSVVPGTVQPIIVIITNFGTIPITSIPVSYFVNGDTPVTSTYNGFLAPLASDTFDIFPVFIVPIGPFTFCSYTDGDANPANDSTCISCNGSPMSINAYQNNSNNRIIVYPNPTSGTFSLKIEDNPVYNTSIAITDILGKIVWKSDFFKPEFNVDISNEPGGVYLISLKSASGISNAKLILVK